MQSLCVRSTHAFDFVCRMSIEIESADRRCVRARVDEKQRIFVNANEIAVFVRYLYFR